MKLKQFWCLNVRSAAPSVLALLVLYGPASAMDIHPPANGKWAQFVVDNLDLRSFPSSLGSRRAEGKITFVDFGILPRSVTAQKAILGTDWNYTIAVLGHDHHQILVCFTDEAANGGSYDAQTLLLLKTAKDGRHLLGSEVSARDERCPHFPR